MEMPEPSKPVEKMTPTELAEYQKQQTTYMAGWQARFNAWSKKNDARTRAALQKSLDMNKKFEDANRDFPEPIPAKPFTQMTHEEIQAHQRKSLRASHERSVATFPDEMGLQMHGSDWAKMKEALRVYGPVKNPAPYKSAPGQREWTPEQWAGLSESDKGAVDLMLATEALDATNERRKNPALGAGVGIVSPFLRWNMSATQVANFKIHGVHLPRQVAADSFQWESVGIKPGSAHRYVLQVWLDARGLNRAELRPHAEAIYAKPLVYVAEDARDEMEAHLLQATSVSQTSKDAGMLAEAKLKVTRTYARRYSNSHVTGSYIQPTIGGWERVTHYQVESGTRMVGRTSKEKGQVIMPFFVSETQYQSGAARYRVAFIETGTGGSLAVSRLQAKRDGEPFGYMTTKLLKTYNSKETIALYQDVLANYNLPQSAIEGWYQWKYIKAAK